MKKRILIVEDEASIIDLLTLILAREGYEIHSCQTGRDAIATMKKVHPHLVILDVMLPGLDGASIVKIMGGRRSPVLYARNCNFGACGIGKNVLALSAGKRFLL